MSYMCSAPPDNELAEHADAKSHKTQSFLFQRPFPATYEDIIKFHSEEYADFLRTADSENMKLMNRQMLKCE